MSVHDVGPWCWSIMLVHDDVVFFLCVVQVLEQCCEGGAISPSSCQYMKDWLKFWRQHPMAQCSPPPPPPLSLILSSVTSLTPSASCYRLPQLPPWTIRSLDSNMYDMYNQYNVVCVCVCVCVSIIVCKQCVIMSGVLKLSGALAI